MSLSIEAGFIWLTKIEEIMQGCFTTKKKNSHWSCPVLRTLIKWQPKAVPWCSNLLKTATFCTLHILVDFFRFLLKNFPLCNWRPPWQVRLFVFKEKSVKLISGRFLTCFMGWANKLSLPILLCWRTPCLKPSTTALSPEVFKISTLPNAELCTCQKFPTRYRQNKSQSWLPISFWKAALAKNRSEFWPVVTLSPSHVDVDWWKYRWRLWHVVLVLLKWRSLFVLQGSLHGPITSRIEAQVSPYCLR